MALTSSGSKSDLKESDSFQWTLTLGLSLLKLVTGHVQVVDVGCVMLGVVELHDLGRDDRLQSAVKVGIRLGCNSKS